jgi:predicted RNA-binding protein
MTYWIVVGTPENFEIAVKRNFDLVGFKSTRRSESSQMEVGDKLIFYLTGVKQFGGLATVASESYEDHKKIFASEKKAGEDFPFRVKTKPEIVLKEGQRLSVPEFVPLMEKTKKGAMKSWGMAFQGNLHRISDHDYKLLEGAMKAASKGKAKPAVAAKAAPAKKPAAKSKAPAAKAAARKTSARRAAPRKAATRR